MGSMTIRKSIAFACMLLTAASSMSAVQTPSRAEAIRLNNRGVALMGQQFTARASDSFAEAFKIDPTFVQAEINEGIAKLTLEDLGNAQKLLQNTTVLDPDSPQAWYNLGLVQHDTDQLPSAVASFQHAARLDPNDVDSLYYEGVCYQEMGEYDKAIAILQTALHIQPLHASSVFVLARSLQRTGHIAEARAQLKRFQYLTSTKISSAIGLSYGSRGHYSTASTVAEPQTLPSRMIPVRLVAQPLLAASPSNSSGPATPFATTGGACMIDATGSGQMDLVLMQSGPQAIRILHRSSAGSFIEWDAQAAGLKASGHAVACAVGDFDGDGLNDLAVALDDQLLLYRNLGHGKFEDVTVKAGLVALNRPSGITFVDYDHDGSLDLLLTGSALKPGDAPNVLWRNNGNGTFTNTTAATGLGGNTNSAAAILTDFNNDRAVDLAITGDGPSPLLYVNPREGKFPTQPLYTAAAGNLPSTVGVAVLDYNKDGWMDIAVTHAGAPGLTLWRNVEAPDHMGRRFERVPLPLHDILRGWGVTPIDIDNDGWIDLAAIVDTKAGPQFECSAILAMEDSKTSATRSAWTASACMSRAGSLLPTWTVTAPPTLSSRSATLRPSSCATLARTATTSCASI